jgi:hypothetical protein
MDAITELTPRGWRARGNGIATWGRTGEEALENLEESQQRIARLASNWRPGADIRTGAQTPTAPQPPASQSPTVPPA